MTARIIRFSPDGMGTRPPQRDRAAAAAKTIAGIYARALRARLNGADATVLADAHDEVAACLRDEFADAKREALNEIRLLDE